MDRVKKLRDGYYHAVGSALYYGGPFSNKYGQSQPAGVLGYASPPRDGFLFPASPAGQSPWVWQAVWSGSSITEVENVNNHLTPQYYESTVGAASAVGLSGYLMGSDYLNPAGSPYKTTFWQGGTKIKLSCSPVASNVKGQLFKF